MEIGTFLHYASLYNKLLCLQNISHDLKHNFRDGILLLMMNVSFSCKEFMHAYVVLNYDKIVFNEIYN
jgi:hypothetical protein